MGEIGTPSEIHFRTEPRSKIEFFSRLHSRLELDVTEVRGIENLLKEKDSKGIVIASDHLSDITLETIIAETAKYRKVGAVSQSSHLEIPIYGKFMQWAGSNRVYPIGTREETKKLRQAVHKYHLNDYQPMIEAVRSGISIVTAAHRPCYDGHLPERPGLSAVTIAQLANAPVVPASVDIIYDKQVDPVKDVKGSVIRFITGKKPRAVVSFAEPIHFDPIPISEIELVEKYMNHQLTKKYELEMAKGLLEKMQLQGKVIMKNIANMLPEEKRGVWSDSQ